MYGPNPYYGSPYAGYYGSPYAGYYTPPYTDSNTTPYTGSYTPPIINFSGAYGANAYGQTSSVSWGNYSFPFESNYNNNTNAYMPYGLYPNYSYGPTSVSTNQNSPKKKTSNNKSKVKTYQGTRKPKAKVTNEPEKKDTTYVITAQDSTTGEKFSIKGNAEDIQFEENGEIKEFKIDREDDESDDKYTFTNRKKSDDGQLTTDDSFSLDAPENDNSGLNEKYNYKVKETKKITDADGNQIIEVVLDAQPPKYVITAQDSTTGEKFSIKGNAEDIQFEENGEIKEFKIDREDDESDDKYTFTNRKKSDDGQLTTDDSFSLDAPENDNSGLNEKYNYKVLGTTEGIDENGDPIIEVILDAQKPTTNYTITVKDQTSEEEKVITGTASDVELENDELMSFSIDPVEDYSNKKYQFINKGTHIDGEITTDDSYEITLPGDPEIDLTNEYAYTVTGQPTITEDEDGNKNVAITIVATPIEAINNTYTSTDYIAKATNKKIKTEDITGKVKNAKFDTEGNLTSFCIIDTTHDKKEGVKYEFELDGDAYKVMSGTNSRGENVLKSKNRYQLIGFKRGNKNLQLETQDPQAAAKIVDVE